ETLAESQAAESCAEHDHVRSFVFHHTAVFLGQPRKAILRTAAPGGDSNFYFDLVCPMERRITYGSQLVRLGWTDGREQNTQRSPLGSQASERILTLPPSLGASYSSARNEATGGRLAQ